MEATEDGSSEPQQNGRSQVKTAHFLSDLYNRAF